MAKFTGEEKLSIVLRYLNGKETYLDPSKEFIEEIQNFQGDIVYKSYPNTLNRLVISLDIHMLTLG